MKKLSIIIFVFLLFIGCPMLTTMETAKVGSKPETPDIYIVGHARQINLFGTFVSDTTDVRPVSIAGVAPLIDGKLTWILIDERLEYAISFGTSGLGISSKLQLIKLPLHLAINAGISGFPAPVWRSYYIGAIGSKDLSKVSEIYGGGKLISWFYAPRATSGIPSPSDYYFDALGAYFGIRLKNVMVELGIYKIFTEGNNYWGKNDYIPTIGISFAMDED